MQRVPEKYRIAANEPWVIAGCDWAGGDFGDFKGVYSVLLWCDVYLVIKRLNLR